MWKKTFTKFLKRWRSIGLITLIGWVIPSPSLAAPDSKMDAGPEKDIFAAQAAQGPQFSEPGPGSVAGTLGSTAWSGKDLSKGLFSMPIGLEFPSTRGELVYPLNPVYSPSGGLSEWGLGVTFELAIRRYRDRGYPDFKSDDFLSPWGHLIRGEDGAYYVKGFKSQVRVKFPSDHEAIAYLSDGSIYYFGGEGRETLTQRGVYAWYLRAAHNAKGESALYHYFSDENRLYLDRIDYGGNSSSLQYQIRLTYSGKKNDNSEFSFVDYRSSERQALRLRVTQVSLRVAGTGGSSPEFGPERYRYELEYQDDPHSVSYSLSKVSKIYASGESEPPRVFQYHSHEEILEKTQWQPLPKLDRFSDRFQGGAKYSLLSPSAFTVLDIDNNGLMGFENPAQKHTAYRQLATDFEAIPLAKASEPELLCRREHLARRVMRLRGPSSPLEVVFLKKFTYPHKTALLICDREGNLSNFIDLQTVTGKTVLDFGPKTRFADMNHSGKPDLIFSNAGSLYIYKNISTPEQSIFETKPTVVQFTKEHHPIADPFLHLSFFIQDVNGDGIPDLILQMGSGLSIFYGKGNYEFDTQFKYVRLESDRGTRIPPRDLEIIFQDLNGDGIPEILAKSSAGVRIFNWNGEYYKEYKPPFLENFFSEKFSKTLSNLSVADFSGSGNTQITIASLIGYFSAELTHASTGLLKSLDDGKGNILEFEYKRPEPTPGLPSRSPILAELQVKSTGKAPQITHYDFQDPALSKKTGGLLGYGTVKVLGKNRTLVDQFIHNDDIDTLTESSREFDLRQKEVQKLSHTTYEDRIFQGIPYKRILTEAEGLVTESSGGQMGIGKKKEFTQYQDEFCPSLIAETSTSGHLTRRTLYEHPAAFSENLTCFEQSLELTGTHEDQSKNFSHSITIEREAHGLPIRVYRSTPNGNRLAQTVQYNSDLKPSAVTEAGMGTTHYQYDPHHRLAQLQQPDGIIKSVDAFSELTDAPLTISTQRGQASLIQNYAYDGLERLLSQWRNLFPGASAATPESHYQYQYANLTHPGWVATQTHLFGPQELAGTSQELKLQTAMGDSIGVGVATDSGWVIQGLTQEAPDDFTSIQWGPKITTADISKLSVTDLKQNAVQVAEKTSSALGFPFLNQQTYQSGIHGEIVTNAHLTPSLLTLTHQENQQWNTVEEKDFDGNKWTFKDESGALNRFEYDALNRFTRVNLPEDTQSLGNSAQVSYDPEGKVKEVKRPGIGKIANTYEPVTGLLASTTFYNADGSEDHQLKLTYDSIGRVNKQVFYKKTGKSEPPESEEYEFYYDGQQPNGIQIAGQLGFLTGLKGPHYSQSIQYTLDGKMKSRETLVQGVKPIREEMTYYSDGTLSTRSVEQEGHERSQFSYLKDHLGRLGAVKLGKATVAQVKYNALQKIASIQLGDALSNFEYDLTTGRLLGYGPHHWTYNQRGLIAQESNGVAGSTINKTYQYSAARELTLDQQGSATNRYSYSPSGLITSFREGDLSTDLHLLSAPRNAIEFKTQQKSTLYELDGSGRVKSTPAATMNYGPDGRLQFTKAGEKKIKFGYSESGTRLMKWIDDQVKEIYLGDSIITDSGIISPIKIGGIVVGVATGNQFKRMNFDVRGTALEDDTQSASPIAAYGARTGQRNSESPAIDYAAVGYDPDLKAYRMEARDYDPVLKRFLTPDPLFLAQPELCVENYKECNLYGYAGGDPVGFVDPTGHHAGIAIGALLGAAGGYYAGTQANLGGGDLARVTLVGAISGGLAGTGAGGLVAGGMVAYTGNLATQAAMGTSPDKLDHGSAAISGGAAVIGGAIGGAAASRIQLPSNGLGSTLSSSELMTRSMDVISNLVGGIAGAGIEMGGQSMLTGGTQNDSGHSNQSDVNRSTDMLHQPVQNSTQSF